MSNIRPEKAKMKCQMPNIRDQTQYQGQNPISATKDVYAQKNLWDYNSSLPSKTLPTTDVNNIPVPVLLEKNDNVRNVVSPFDAVWMINELVYHIFNFTDDKLLTLVILGSVNKRFRAFFGAKAYFNFVFSLNKERWRKIFKLIRCEQPNFGLNMLLKIKELDFSEAEDSILYREGHNDVLAFFANNPTSKLTKLRMSDLYNGMILGILPQVKELEIDCVRQVKVSVLNLAASFPNLKKLQITNLSSSTLNISACKELEMVNIKDLTQATLKISDCKELKMVHLENNFSSTLEILILEKLKSVKIPYCFASRVKISEENFPQLVIEDRYQKYVEIIKLEKSL